MVIDYFEQSRAMRAVAAPPALTQTQKTVLRTNCKLAAKCPSTPFKEEPGTCIHTYLPKADGWAPSYLYLPTHGHVVI